MKHKGIKKLFSLVIVFAMMFSMMMPVGVAYADTLVASISVTGAGNASTVVNNGTLQMSAAILPADATEQTVTWSVTNGTGAATIDAFGLLTGTGVGDVTVTAAAIDGSVVTGSITITVTAPVAVTGITVTGAGNASTVVNTGTLQMSAAVLPVNATYPSVTWSVTNGTGAATINNAGLLTGTGAGTVTVTATADDGSGIAGHLTITVTVSNLATISITNLNASEISSKSNDIQVTLTGGNTWNINMSANGTYTGPLFTNLYPTLKNCFSTTANQTQWSTLFDSATFKFSSDKIITMTIPAQQYKIQSSQTVTFTPQSSLMQDLSGTPATPPHFNITADYATVSGTLTPSVTQSKIISGGQTLSIKLSNCNWAYDTATMNTLAKKTLLFTGLASTSNDATATAEWKKVTDALKAVDNPIVVSGGTLTMTLPAVPNYNAYAPQTITFSLDTTLLKDTTGSPYNSISVPFLTNITNNSFVISPDNASTTISWTPTPTLTESKLKDNVFDTLSLTLGNNTWADIDNTAAKQQALLDGFTTSTDVTAWNNVKAAILASGTGTGTFARSNGNKTLTIKIPIPIAIPGSYSISTDQTINVNVPATVLTYNYAVSLNPLSFTIIADHPVVAISGTLTAGVNELDIVNGGKTIVATLTNATWDPFVTTDIMKRGQLIDDLLYSADPQWTATILTTIKAGATYTLNEDLSVVTIALPPVSGFNISSNLSISSKVQTVTGTNPAFTQALSPSFTITPITNQSASISGTVTTATESDIVTGGKTLVLTLKNDVWAQDVVSNNNMLSALGTGIGAIWTLTSSNVVRTSDTVLTITLPPALAYDANALNRTINVIIPWKESVTNKPLLTTSVQSINAGSFIIKAVTATLSGTAVTAPLDSASVITGGKTIVITLTNATWVSDVSTASRLADLKACVSSVSTAVPAVPTDNWNYIENNISAQDITLSSNKVLTIKLPPMPTYSWNGNSEQVTFSIVGTILPNLITEKLSSTKILTASPNISIGQTLQSPITASLSSTPLTMLVSDVVDGNKKIIITLSNGSWDPLLPTNSAKIGTLVNGFKSNCDSVSWAMVQTALKSANLITDNPFSLNGTTNTLTITLPKVPSFDPINSQEVRLTIPKTLLVSTTVDVTATGFLTINLPSPTGSPSTLESMLGDASFATLINGGWPLQKIYLAVPKKYITSVVVKQYPINNTTVNSLDIYTNSDVSSVNVLVNGTNYTSGTSTSSGTGKKFNVGFATVITTTASTSTSTLPIDATISVLNSSNSKLQTDVTIKISGSKTYSLAPTTDLSGHYSLYRLVNNKSLLDSILKPGAYVPTDIMVETTT